MSESAQLPPSQPPVDQPASFAEVKAQFASSWDLATPQVSAIEQVGLPAPPGFVVWRIVGTRGRTALPALVLQHALPRSGAAIPLG